MMKPVLSSIAALLLTMHGIAQPHILPPGPDTLTAADTLTARVAEWDKEPVTSTPTGEIRTVLQGTTRDLSLLDIRAITLNNRQSINQSPEDDNADELLIIREGSLLITIGDSTTTLGPGGIALFPAGTAHGLSNTTTPATTYYLFRFQSRLPKDKALAGQVSPPFLLDWPNMKMQHTAKGETRPICSRGTTWLTKIDLHATTLNPGEVSHAPHTHRAEEIILMRSGHVQEFIDGRHNPASAGDLIFLPSGSLHAVENKSNEQCEYFALQWTL